ncbi:MAG: HNH endonuclease [Chloroflexota bacterium]
MSKSYIPEAIRERVASTARYRCGYCLTSEMVVGTPMEIDHLLPESLGGVTEENNLWLACSLCNNFKSNRLAGLDTYTGKTEPLFNPRSQDWNEHFEWSEDSTAIKL